MLTIEWTRHKPEHIVTSMAMANRRAWIPAAQLLDIAPVPPPEEGPRVWDAVSGTWMLPPAPAPAQFQCVNDGSGVFWRVGDRTVEQSTRAGALAVAEYLGLPFLGPTRRVRRFTRRDGRVGYQVD